MRSDQSQPEFPLIRVLTLSFFILMASVSCKSSPLDGFALKKADSSFFNKRINGIIFSKKLVLKKNIPCYRTRFGFQVQAGASHMKHNSVGKEIFRNLWGNAVEAYIFYDQVFIGVSGGSSIDNIRGSGTRLKLFRFDLRAGYNFKAIHHINIQPYFAMSRTLLHVTQTGENSPECKGIALGLNMNKTFKLSTMKYFFVFVDGSFNKVNYEPVDVMKMGYFLIKMGIGYKQLFLKRASPAAIGYSIPH